MRQCYNKDKNIFGYNSACNNRRSSVTVRHDFMCDDRIRFVPVTMTSRFLNFNSISYTEDRHELRVSGTACRLLETMSGTGEIFISGTVVYNFKQYFNVFVDLDTFLYQSYSYHNRISSNLVRLFVIYYYRHNFLRHSTFL